MSATDQMSPEDSDSGIYDYDMTNDTDQFSCNLIGLIVDQGGDKPGKLREFEKLSRSQGNLNFCRKNLENSGKMKL